MTAPANGRLALLLATLLLAGCMEATVGPTDLSSAPPASPDATDVASPRPTPAPTLGIEAVLRGDWRRIPVDPREYEAVGFVDASCRAAEPAIGSLPLANIDARGLGRLVLIYASGPTSAAWECRAAVDAQTAADVVVIALQESGEPIADEAIDTRHYEAVELGDQSGIIAVGRIGLLADEAIAQFNSDETFVYASIGGLWWVMWWPGSEAINGVAATDTHNQVIGETRPELPLIP